MEAAKRFKKGVIKIEGSVTLRKTSASIGGHILECAQRKVIFQLISIHQETGHGLQSCPAYLEWKEQQHSKEHLSKDSEHRITFEWDPDMGIPRAVLVTNNHSREFFLKKLSIQIPEGVIRFLCNSWIYPKGKTGIYAERVFFANNSYLPHETPLGLVDLRNKELERLRGNGTGERQTLDRIYDYDVYNDLGDPDTKKELERKVLGGSQELPYPRRCRTGRRRSNKNQAFESRNFLCRYTQSFYIPSDEQFHPECLSEFRDNASKALSKEFKPKLKSVVKPDFGSFEEVRRLYASLAKEVLPGLTIMGILNTDYKANHKFAVPAIISNYKANHKFAVPAIISRHDGAWMTDEEFARQTLSGLNPMVIQRLEKFPPSGHLNEKIYGSQQSEITAKHILESLDGITVEKAIESKRLFILDYYDAYMPYVERVNQLPTSKAYATRSLFFLADAGTLKPVAIELCLPPTSVGLGSRVFTPDYSGEDKGWLWRLAKAHVRANDSGYHQLVSHWLRTHAVVEPFIIATHRHLSKLHPLHKLLIPHFRNTMEINRSARQSLINAGGIIEQCFTSGKYSMEISAQAYIGWRFNEQGLPADLLKRGMAVSDEVNGVKLVIEDYPYAVDGLEIWAALKCWVSEYTSVYYQDDQSVERDSEVHEWWKDIVEKGHGDKKHEKRGWYKMKSVEDLKEGITTLIWIASAHHAAVNFGQYGYAGFMPNQPSSTRKLIPEEGSEQYSRFLDDPEAYFLKTVSNRKTCAITMGVLELLSKHSTDEVYLGQGSASDWTDNSLVEEAFERFRFKLFQIEENIKNRNKDQKLKNRAGPAEVPYTLLYPGISETSETSSGLTFRGIPNSVSI